MSFTMNLLKRLQSAYSVVVLSGAGMSAASGIPTFRGRDGLWNKYRPEELATMEAFRRNPELVWEWYCWRRDLIRGAQPNAGHLALAEMERYFPEFSVITQNVDNLHQAAGTRNITELHGNIMRNRCINSRCGVSSAVLDHEVARMGKQITRCPECGSLVRPGVVWFGENLPEAAIARAQTLSTEAEVFFSAGTSSTVAPASSLPYMAKGNGAYVVEINPEETPLSSVADERVAAGAHEVFPKLLQVIQKLRQRVR